MPKLKSRDVLALLLVATTINYIDRQTLSVLAPLLQKELHLSSLEYSYVINSFLVVYAVMYLLMGGVVDRVGTRKGLGLAIIWWSLAEMLHGAAIGIKTLCLFRALLAVGEAAIIPSGVKAVAEWFKPKQRAVAVGTFEMGLSLGPLLAPPLVVWISLRYGWRQAFFWTGIMGLIWVVPWWLFYRAPADMVPTQSNPKKQVQPESMKWAELFQSRKAWAIGCARFFADPVWYFYLFWLPKYMADAKGLSLKLIGELAWIPYLASLIGGVMGGAASSWLVRRGVATVKARQCALLLSSMMVASGVFSIYLTSLFSLMVVTSLAAFAMQVWGANVDTLPIDLFPAEHVAQTTGFAGLSGAVGGILFTAGTGYAVQHYSYTPVWVASAVMYPLGLTLSSLLLRRTSPSNRPGDINSPR
jgi:ACS family hexuronate transporter-like MFS transporter